MQSKSNWVLVVGASGTTGKHLVEQLLVQDQNVKVIVRPTSNIPQSWKHNNRVKIIEGSILDIPLATISDYVKDCNAVASCLGHNMNLKGLYGKPRKLVTDAVKLLCNAIQQNNPDQKTKFVLMNGSGTENKDANEKVSITQKVAISIMRFLMPPLSDNEGAAEYLRTQIGQKIKSIEWSVVRPDNLINKDVVTPYDNYPSPNRSALFNAGKTSRINVGNFMARLITDNELWEKWKAQMPVIYNSNE